MNNIKNIFYEKMNLRLFHFHIRKYACSFLTLVTANFTYFIIHIFGKLKGEKIIINWSRYAKTMSEK